jgi:predicted N-acyltransferase
LPGDHFLQPEQLAVNEAAAFPDISFLYALVFIQGKPVAAAYFQVLSLKSKHVSPTAYGALPRTIWRVFSGITHPKLVVAGHLFRHDMRSFYALPALEGFDAFRCYKAAIDAALGKSCAAAVLVKDMPEMLVTYFQHFAPQYLMLRNDISMEMDIPAAWHSFDDYEKALKHKYAQRLRKVRQGLEGLEIKELGDEAIIAQKEKIHELYLQVCLHQPVTMGFLSPDFIVQLRKFYNGQLKVWALYENGEMIAFLSGWAKETVFDMFYIGFDYRRNADRNLYFNILFLSLQQAIMLKKSKLILGRTALDAKARLGCRPRYLHTFLYIRNAVLRNYVLRRQQSISAEEGSWENKHPLKK